MPVPLSLQLFDDMVGLLDPELQPTSSEAEVCVCVCVYVCVCTRVVLMLGASTHNSMCIMAPVSPLLGCVCSIDLW